MTTYSIPKDVKCLLLDMDGTLVNTEPVGPATFLEQLLNYGVKPEDGDYELFVKVWRRDGADIHEDEFLANMAKKHKVNTRAEDYINEFFELYKHNITKADALPGVDTFLAKAAERPALKLAVVTASKLSQVQAVLDNHGWTGYFNAIVSEEDISFHKPNPEAFIVGMKKVGASNSETIIFEDSKSGTLAGKAANCTVVGLRAGNDLPQDLSVADVVVGSFEDILLEL